MGKSAPKKKNQIFFLGIILEFMWLILTHLKLLNQSSKYELIGFYDPIKENADKVQEEFGYKSFDTIQALIDADKAARLTASE